MKKGKRSLPVYLELSDVMKRLRLGKIQVEHMIKTKRIKIAAETHGGIKLFASADIEWLAVELERTNRDILRDIYGYQGEDGIDFDGNIS